MKILMTADHHIKLGQKNVPRDWAENRFRMLFNRINSVDCTIHIMSGDIFDRVPKLDELQLFFDFIASVKVPTFITTGNHEAEKKNSSFFRFLKDPVERLNPLVKIVLEVEEHYNFYIVPYEFIKKKETWENLDPMPVFTHVRGEIPPHVKPEIPLEWLDKFPIVFAGDLHSHKNTQRNIVYPGSPVTTSFHRNETSGSNGYLLIDSETWDWEWEDFKLPQLIRATVSSKAEMIKTDFHHTIYELEGAMDSFEEGIDKELLDKRIIKRTSEVELVLDESMTFEDELVEYLTYILQIDDVEGVMTEYHEHNKP